MPKLIKLSEYVEWEDENGDIVQLKRQEVEAKIYQMLVQKIGFDPQTLIGKKIHVAIPEQIQGEGETQFYIGMQWFGSTIGGYSISVDHEMCDLGLILASDNYLIISLAKENVHDPEASFSTTGSDPKAYLNWIGMSVDYITEGSTVEWSAQLTTPEYGDTMDIDAVVKIEGI